MKLITTSWDDGHPLDFRIAQLLDKYNMRGTFYIPRANDEHAVMNEKEIKDLSKHFEIGGHTLNHVRLWEKATVDHEYEISGSYQWLKGLLDSDPISFCYPGGVYNKTAIQHVRNAGYKISRTTELLSIENDGDQAIVPTSLQLYEHSQFTFCKHLLKRKKVRNLVQWMCSGATSNMLKLADYYVKRIDDRGEGCFHLWGHSWEIEEFGLWAKLEELLRHLSGYNEFSYIENGKLIDVKN
ncbi:MAG: hypothetical protein EOP48_10145 [Sphingobacteriales bacterium]|nr:MAG: hypothetical protein EOP48_10145 [Sphingobacteriales bacterium]